jgi:hypothetical protein
MVSFMEHSNMTSQQLLSLQQEVCSMELHGHA